MPYTRMELVDSGLFLAGGRCVTAVAFYNRPARWLADLIGAASG